MEKHHIQFFQTSKNPMNSLQQYTKELAYSIVPQPLERATVENFLSDVEEKVTAHFGFDFERCITFGEFARETSLRHTIDKESNVDLMILFQNDDYIENFQGMKEKVIEFIFKTFPQPEETSKELKIQMKYGCIQLVPAIVADVNSKSTLLRSSINNETWIESNPLLFDENINKKNEETAYLLKPVIRLLKYWNLTHGNYFSTETIELFVSNRMTTSQSLHLELLQLLEQLPVLLKDNVRSIRVLQEVQELTGQLKQLFLKKHDEFETVFIFKQIFPPIIQ